MRCVIEKNTSRPAPAAVRPQHANPRLQATLRGTRQRLTHRPRQSTLGPASAHHNPTPTESVNARLRPASARASWEKAAPACPSPTAPASYPSTRGLPGASPLTAAPETGASPLTAAPETGASPPAPRVCPGGTRKALAPPQSGKRGAGPPRQRGPGSPQTTAKCHQARRRRASDSAFPSPRWTARLIGWRPALRLLLGGTPGANGTPSSASPLRLGPTGAGNLAGGSLGCRVSWSQTSQTRPVAQSYRPGTTTTTPGVDGWSR